MAARMPGGRIGGMGFRVRPVPPYRAPPATSRRPVVAAILATASVALSGLALALLTGG